MTMRLGGVAVLANGFDGESPAPIYAGLTLMLTGVLYDMIGAPISADRQNRRRWAAMPTAIASPSGTMTPGLAVGGAF